MEGPCTDAPSSSSASTRLHSTPQMSASWTRSSRNGSCQLRRDRPWSKDHGTMINWLIEVALRNRFIVIALFLLIGAWGYWALLTTPIDAIPDLSDNQVIVFSDWSGRSPQEVEDQITYPLTVSLQGLPGVRVVRSASAFGFS